MGWDKQSESHSIITGLKLDKPLSSLNGYLMAEHQSNESRQVLKFCSKLNSIVHFFCFLILMTMDLITTEFFCIRKGAFFDYRKGDDNFFAVIIGQHEISWHQTLHLFPITHFRRRNREIIIHTITTILSLVNSLHWWAKTWKKQQHIHTNFNYINNSNNGIKWNILTKFTGVVTIMMTQEVERKLPFHIHSHDRMLP